MTVSIKMKLPLSCVFLLKKMEYAYVFVYLLTDVFTKSCTRTQDIYFRFTKLKILSLFHETGLLKSQLCWTVPLVSNCWNNTWVPIFFLL